MWLPKTRCNRGCWMVPGVQGLVCLDLLHSGPATILYTFQKWWWNHLWFIKCELIWESAFSSKPVCVQLVTFCFLIPPFAEHACHLPHSPENRMEAHKSLTCFRWPYKSCMCCLINPACLLWLRNGEALPWRAVGAGGGGGPPPLLSGPQLLNGFLNCLFTSAHISRAVSQRGEFSALEDSVWEEYFSLAENNMALSGN